MKEQGDGDRTRGRRQKKRTMTDQEGGYERARGRGQDKGTAAEEANHDKPASRL